MRDFSAGTVIVPGVDTKDDHQIVLDGTITAKREPDGVTWISDDLFASANEGDYQGGSRGWSIFDRSGRVVWDAGNSLEHLAVEHGLYPDKRSDAKGIEPENVAFARSRGVPCVFVNAERGNFTAVYERLEPAPAAVPADPADRGRSGGCGRGTVPWADRGLQRDRGPGQQPARRRIDLRDRARRVPARGRAD